MNTRSRINEKNNTNFKIDFDEASIAWRANKKLIGSCQFKYKCLIKTQNGNECKREALAGCDACKLHSKKLNQHN